MAKKYYLCQVVGDGATPETAYRPMIADVLKASPEESTFSAILPTKPDGTPVYNWVLCLVSKPDLSGLDSEPGVIPISEKILDTTFGTVPTPKRNQIISTLSGYGVDTSGWDKNTLISAIIDDIGKYLEPAFDINTFEAT